jgi:hypothetical protein
VLWGFCSERSGILSTRPPTTVLTHNPTSPSLGGPATLVAAGNKHRFPVNRSELIPRDTTLMKTRVRILRKPNQSPLSPCDVPESKRKSRSGWNELLACSVMRRWSLARPIKHGPGEKDGTATLFLLWLVQRDRWDRGRRKGMAGLFEDATATILTWLIQEDVFTASQPARSTSVGGMDPPQIPLLC